MIIYVPEQRNHTENQGESGRGHDQPGGQQDEERWIVARELQLGLFAITEVAVNLWLMKCIKVV